MNITPEMMYWLTRCDNIVIASVILAVAFGSLFAVSIILGIIIDKEDAGPCYVICPLAFVIGMIFVSAAVFVPSTKEMAAIYVIPKIANSQTVKDLGEGVVTLAREWIEELRPAMKKGGAK